MPKIKAKLLLYAFIGAICTLIIGGLAFAVPNMFASAAILPDRFDPDRFTSVTFPELKEPDAQKYYGNGYWVCQDMTYKTLGYSDSATSNILNVLWNYDDGQYMYDPSGTDSFDYGSTTADDKPGLSGYEILLDGQGADNYNSENALYQMQYLKFTLAKEGKISFTYRVSSEDDFDAFYLVVNSQVMLKVSGTGNDGNGVIGSYEQALPKGTYEIAFAYTKDHCDSYGSDSALITNLEFGEGPQGGIYKDSEIEWENEFGSKLVEENLELICNAYYDASGNDHWVLGHGGGYYKTFPMSITGTAGSYTLTSAEMLCEHYENSNYNYDTLPICLVEIPFTLSSAQTISFNYELYSESDYDFLLVFIDNTYVFGLSGAYTDSFTSSTLSAGNHTIMIAVVKDSSVDDWYENDYPFEAQITNLNITSSVDVSKLMPQANKQSYSYKGKISAITNYDIYDVFASSSDASNGANYGGEAGTYSDVGTVFDNTNGYYFKTIHEAANYFNSIQTASTTFNMVILDDIEVENEATFNNANVSTFNIYTDDNDTLRTETNPYILRSVSSSSILDLESSAVKFRNANPIKFITTDTYSIKKNESRKNNGKDFHIYGHIIFESNYTDIYSNISYFAITANGKVESINTSGVFEGQYLIESKEWGSVGFSGSGQISVTLTNKSFSKSEQAYYYMVASGTKTQYRVITTGSNVIDHDIYTKARDGNDLLCARLTNGISNPLRVKFYDDAFTSYANNYSHPVGNRLTNIPTEFAKQFVYYKETEDVGGYKFREILETLADGTQRYQTYLLENIGVVFDQNIPEATILGETIRESGDTSPTTTISVPYGFKIDEDSEYASVPSYDVYGYKKLGWSSSGSWQDNANPYTNYSCSTSQLLDTETNNVQITHAFVGGTNQDNYGASTDRKIYFYSRWYKFLYGRSLDGDYWQYDDYLTTDTFEGTNIIPIYFAEEFVYLSNILGKTDKTTTINGNQAVDISPYFGYSYAIMKDMNIQNYTNYGKDSKTGDGKWIYSANTNTVNSYMQMCTTQNTAFTGNYFVGGISYYDTSSHKYYISNYDTNGGEYVQRSISFKQGGSATTITNNYDTTNYGDGVIFGNVFGDENNRTNIQNICVEWATFQSYYGQYLGGIVGYATYTNFYKCNSGNSVDCTKSSMPTSMGGIVGTLDYGDIIDCYNAGSINYGENTCDNVGGIVGYIYSGRDMTSNSMSGCTSTASVVYGTKYVGGIVGYSRNCTISESVSNGSVVQGEDLCVGGVVGYGRETSINECSNFAEVNATTSKAGGIAGELYLAEVSGCVNGGAVAVSNSSGYAYAGGIIGFGDEAEITNCSNGYIDEDSNIIAPAVSGYQEVGGIVGHSVGSYNISNCTNYGNITNRASSGGGIVGYVYNTAITSCSNYGNVSGSSFQQGGIAGKMDGDEDFLPKITSCTNSGNVSGTYNIGGIAGLLANEYVSITGTSTNKTINTGKINGSETAIGGIVGVTYGVVSYAANRGDVKLTSSSEWADAGGIAGKIYNKTISYCTNIGNVSAGNSKAVGGIAGSVDSATITSCTNSGAISNTLTHVGGIGGHVFNSASISSCTNEGTVNAVSYIGGIVGKGLTINISSCTNTSSGSITASTGDAGGIVGQIGDYAGGTINSCINEAQITVGTYSAGGIAGCSWGTNVTNCTNRGYIYASGSSANYAGGIIGAVEGDPTITGNKNYASVYGLINVGGIVGRLYSSNPTFNNNHNGDSVTNSTITISGGGEVGGIVGHTWGKIQNCHNYIGIIQMRNSGWYAGGITGWSDNGYITGCNNYQNVDGSVSGSSRSQFIGGICGYITGNSVYNCKNGSDSYQSHHVASYGENTGGITGGCWNGKVESCTNYAYVEGPVTTATGDPTGVGGISGSAGGSYGGYTIYNCTNYADVKGRYSVGGIVGYVHSSSIISNCTTSGASIYSQTMDAGGIVGSMQGGDTVKNCTVTGCDIRVIERNAGGIVGWVGATANWSVESCTLSGNNVIRGDNTGMLIGKNSTHGYIRGSNVLSSYVLMYTKNSWGIQIGYQETTFTQYGTVSQSGLSGSLYVNGTLSGNF